MANATGVDKAAGKRETGGMETVDISEVRTGDVLASGDLVTGVSDALMAGIRLEINGTGVRRIARGTYDNGAWIPTTVALAYRPRCRREG